MDSAAIKIAFTTVVQQGIAVTAGGFSVWASKKGLNVGSEITLLAGAGAILLTNVLWGIGGRLLKKWKLNEALLAAAGTTYIELDVIAEKTPVLQQLAESLTVPEAEK